MSESTALWARRWLRVSGEKEPKDWHLINSRSGSLSWCGKRVLQYVGTQHTRLEPAEQPEGRVCQDCVRRAAEGRQKPWSRR